MPLEPVRGVPHRVVRDGRPAARRRGRGRLGRPRLGRGRRGAAPPLLVDEPPHAGEQRGGQQGPSTRVRDRIMGEP